MPVSNTAKVFSQNARKGKRLYPPDGDSTPPCNLAVRRETETWRLVKAVGVLVRDGECTRVLRWYRRGAMLARLHGSEILQTIGGWDPDVGFGAAAKDRG